MLEMPAGKKMRPGWLDEIKGLEGGQSGPSNKTSRVFIPWGSCLMVQELK